MSTSQPLFTVIFGSGSQLLLLTMSDRGGRGGRGAPRGQYRGDGGDRGGGAGRGGQRGDRGGQRGDRGGQRGDRGGPRGAPRGGGQQYGRLGDDEYTIGNPIYT